MPTVDVNTKEKVNVDLVEKEQVGIALSMSEKTDLVIEDSNPEVSTHHRPLHHVTVEEWDGHTTAEMAYEMATQAITAANEALNNSRQSSLDKYSLEQYNALRNAGQLEHKMYCIYVKGRLTYIYIYRTLIAKRAEEGQAVSSGKFPFIFPIIFA